jgi:hypothetical protein
MEEYGGYYDDDGNKINMNLIPTPQLCLSCTKRDDPNEEMLCSLNRLDQHLNGKEFECGAYVCKF